MSVDRTFTERRVRLYLNRIERAGVTITPDEMYAGRGLASCVWARWVVENVPFQSRSSDRHDPCAYCGHGMSEHYSTLGPCGKIVKASDGQELRCACSGRVLYAAGVGHGYKVAERQAHLDRLALVKKEEAKKVGWIDG